MPTEVIPKSVIVDESALGQPSFEEEVDENLVQADAIARHIQRPSDIAQCLEVLSPSAVQPTFGHRAPLRRDDQLT